MEGVLAGVKHVDTTVSGPMAHKYATLPRVVANLQPADVGRIFACSDDPMAFLPQWGLHVTEFCLGYCNNLPHKRTDGTPALLLPIHNAAALAHGSMYGSKTTGTTPSMGTSIDKGKDRDTDTDKDKDKDAACKRKRGSNLVTNPVADPPPRLTKRKKLDTPTVEDAHEIVAPLDDDGVTAIPDKREGDGKRRMCSPARTRSAEPTIKTRSHQRKRPRR